MSVTLVCHKAETASQINSSRRNAGYFPDVELPEQLQATAELEQGLANELVLLAVPTSYLEPVLLGHSAHWQAWQQRDGMLCSCSKGLLLNPVRRVERWLAELLPQVRLAQLSGPNLAREIMAGQPAACVVNGDDATAAAVQSALNCPLFRVYTGTDIVGAEVAGFYKNIIAIAAGIVTGLGLGENTRAALLTRGLAEMSRLAAFFGGEQQTLYGLAGVGDLAVTCSSPQSRNFQAGLLRARQLPLDEVLRSLSAPGGALVVAEGIQASRALHEWPRELQAGDPALAAGWPELPIAQEVYRVMHEAADPREAIARLMGRPPRAE